jgi:predicted DCC family thiol-disulfide oxidoreductase YuxK
VRPVVLFDGVCNLCNASVLFVIDRDPGGRFVFAPLQGEEAAELLRERGYASDPDNPASILLVEGDRVFDRSTAALRIARGLSGLWPVLSVLLAVPRPLRDAAYDWAARRRYRWFGKLDACRMPTPELRSRFLGDGVRA